MSRLVVALTMLAGVLTLAPVAGATIVVGEGIAGVKIGDSVASVKRKLGRPDQDRPGRPRQLGYQKRKLGVWFNKGKVTVIFTFNARERTPKGIGPGSTFAAVAASYPGACFTPGIPHCALVIGRTSTQFSAPNGKRVQTVKIQKLLRRDEV